METLSLEAFQAEGAGALASHLADMSNRSRDEFYSSNSAPAQSDIVGMILAPDGSGDEDRTFKPASAEIPRSHLKPLPLPPLPSESRYYHDDHGRGRQHHDHTHKPHQRSKIDHGIPEGERGREWGRDGRRTRERERQREREEKYERDLGREESSRRLAYRRDTDRSRMMKRSRHFGRSDRRSERREDRSQAPRRTLDRRDINGKGRNHRGREYTEHEQRERQRQRDHKERGYRWREYEQPYQRQRERRGGREQRDRQDTCQQSGRQSRGERERSWNQQREKNNQRERRGAGSSRYEREREWDRERDRNRDRGRDREHDHRRDRDERDGNRHRNGHRNGHSNGHRNRDPDRDRRGRDRERDLNRNRDRDHDRDHHDRDRDRDQDGDHDDRLKSGSKDQLCVTAREDGSPDERWHDGSNGGQGLESRDHSADPQNKTSSSQISSQETQAHDSSVKRGHAFDPENRRAEDSHRRDRDERDGNRHRNGHRNGHRNRDPDRDRRGRDRERDLNRNRDRDHDRDHHDHDRDRDQDCDHDDRPNSGSKNRLRVTAREDGSPDERWHDGSKGGQDLESRDHSADAQNKTSSSQIRPQETQAHASPVKRGHAFDSENLRAEDSKQPKPLSISCECGFSIPYTEGYKYVQCPSCLLFTTVDSDTYLIPNASSREIVSSSEQYVEPGISSSQQTKVIPKITQRERFVVDQENDKRACEKSPKILMKGRQNKRIEISRQVCVAPTGSGGKRNRISIIKKSERNRVKNRTEPTPSTDQDSTTIAPKRRIVIARQSKRTNPDSSSKSTPSSKPFSTKTKRQSAFTSVRSAQINSRTTSKPFSIRRRSTVSSDVPDIDLDNLPAMKIVKIFEREPSLRNSSPHRSPSRKFDTERSTSAHLLKDLQSHSPSQSDSVVVPIRHGVMRRKRKKNQNLKFVKKIITKRIKRVKKLERVDQKAISHTIRTDDPGDGGSDENRGTINKKVRQDTVSTPVGNHGDVPQPRRPSQTNSKGTSSNDTQKERARIPQTSNALNRKKQRKSFSILGYLNKSNPLCDDPGNKMERKKARFQRKQKENTSRRDSQRRRTNSRVRR